MGSKELSRSCTIQSDEVMYSQTFGNTVFSGKFPESEIIKQTIPGAGESEYLIRFGTNKLNIR